jgi:hypothetical protein
MAGPSDESQLKSATEVSGSEVTSVASYMRPNPANMFTVDVPLKCTIHELLPRNIGMFHYSRLSCDIPKLTAHLGPHHSATTLHFVQPTNLLQLAALCGPVLLVEGDNIIHALALDDARRGGFRHAAVDGQALHTPVPHNTKQLEPILKLRNTPPTHYTCSTHRT